MTRMLCLCLALIVPGLLRAQTAGVEKLTLNGLEWTIDRETGGLLKLSYPGVGVMLETTPDSASMVDIAFPIPAFEPLRRATRFSKGAVITRQPGGATIHWDDLGGSRTAFDLMGKVSATVTLKEDSDGKSVRMRCRIQNNSGLAIPQILFPDFFGLVPFCGKDETEFRTGSTALKPFRDLAVTDKDKYFFANGSSRWFPYGFVLDGKSPAIRWMDFGGRKGGMSIYSTNWGSNRANNEGVMLKLSEANGRLRFMNIVYEEIKPGESWESDEFVLTPHQYGWAKGIATYREWARKNTKRLYPLPDHVRDGLGFRTLWMRFTFYPEDPEGTYFTFKDLPEMAREAKEHGLDEMSIWNWYDDCFTLPLPAPARFLGTQRDMLDALAACKKIGVNVAPFSSFMTANPETAKRYGLTPNAEYNVDLEFIPQANPRYAKRQKGAAIVPTSNKEWQENLYTSFKNQFDLGIMSIGWDQYFNVGPGRYLDTVSANILRMMKEKDPQATFSGEAGTNMENECDYLDYTWNWDYHDNCDWRPLIAALHGPRINWNIDRSVEDVKVRFADNYYLNVYPRKPDLVNGSDRISNHPGLSATLKQCARLRKQFLHYFVDGTFIADCVLTRDCDGGHVSTYVLPESMLIIVVNKGEKGSIKLEADFTPWLKSSSGRYSIKQYDDGRLLRTISARNAVWTHTTPQMEKLGIYLYEVRPE